MTNPSSTTSKAQSTKIHWIAGAGKSGIAAAALCRAKGLDVFLSDTRVIPEQEKERLDSLNIPFEDGGHSLDNLLSTCETLIISPGIPLTSSIATRARQAGIPIRSEIDLAAQYLPANCKIVAITGTNGKSTTTHYLAQLFGERGIACGNLGRPLADVALTAKEEDVIAVELSSYQLETTWTFRPKISILLNIQDDHLARYGTLLPYFAAKWRLACLTQPEGVVIVARHMLEFALRNGFSLPTARLVILEDTIPAQKPNALIPHTEQNFANLPLPLSVYGNLHHDNPLTLFPKIPSHDWAGIHIANEKEIKASIDIIGQSHVFAIPDPCIPGAHNAKNILAASAAGLVLGLSPDVISQQWSRPTTRYNHLPHRLEDVTLPSTTVRSRSGTPRNVRIINDSKATNVESVKVALESFVQPVRLLLGGDPKNDDFRLVIPYLKKPVIRIYPFGKAGKAIASSLSACDSLHVAAPLPGLIEAAELALEESQNDDIILLSPGCASFDEFRNFEHRGDMFKEWAQAAQERK